MAGHHVPFLFLKRIGKNMAGKDTRHQRQGRHAVSTDPKQRSAARYRKQELRRKVLIMAVLVIALMIAFGVLWSGVLSQGLMRPGAVNDLTADARYGGVTLSWDKARRADGYVVYEDQDGTYVEVGRTEGKKNCTYTVKDYTFNEDHTYRVAAYNYSRFSNKNFEGAPSEEVTAEYDTSEHAQQIPIITYHKVVPSGDVEHDGLCVTEDKLDDHLRYLKENGFTTLTLDEFYDWYHGKKEFPEKSVVITFDDGFYGTYYIAYPLIKKYGQAATVFCIGEKTGETTQPFDDDPLAEKDYYVGYDKIKEVRQDYPRFAFESHTYDMHKRHKGVKPAKGFSYEEILADCEQNAKFGFKYLAYPWGTYTKKMQKALKASGYKMAFTYRPFYYATRLDDPYAVNRIKISGKIEMNNFIDTVNLDKEDFINPDITLRTK